MVLGVPMVLPLELSSCGVVIKEATGETRGGSC